jgi:hypothetical protein
VPRQIPKRPSPKPPPRLGVFCISPQKGSIQDHAAKAAWSFDPDFRHFRLGHLRWQQNMLRISDKGGPYGKPPKKRVVPLPRRLQAPRETHFALNEPWVMGSRQVQKIVKRVAGHSGVGSKSWIEPFRGDMQKTPY